MARNAVGAVNSTFTLYSESSRQKGAGVGCADWFAFEEDGRCSGKERCVKNVGMANYPANI